jgi:protease-4
VFGVLPSFQGTLAKLGIGVDGVKTTPLSGEPDLLRGPSPEANALLQTGVETTYRRFLGIVAQARHKTPQQVDAIAQGRVWDGGTAHQLGLVDGFGGMDEAVAKAVALANLGDERRTAYFDPAKSFEDELIEAYASDNDDDSAASTDAYFMLVAAPKMQMTAMIEQLKSLLDGPVIQVRCLECVSLAPPLKKKDVKAAGFWASLLERLFAA